MSTTALPSARPASRTLRDVRSAVLDGRPRRARDAGAACAALAALTWLAWGDLGGDTGYDWLAGARTAHGELPYIDYVYYYGPLTPLLLGAVQLVTGSALDGAIAVGLVLAVTMVGLTYAVARILAPAVPAALAALLTAVAALRGRQQLLRLAARPVGADGRRARARPRADRLAARVGRQPPLADGRRPGARPDRARTSPTA